MGVDERVASLAASPTQYADFVVNDGNRQVLVVEMKRPGLFKRNVHAEIPRLHLLVQQGVGRPPTAREEGASRAVMQLFGYMQKLNLRYGILSLFDLIYVAHRQEDFGETLFISDGIDCGSKRFLGVIAFMLQSATEDPGDFKNKVSKPISLTHAPRGLKRRGPQYENKEKEKTRSVRQRLEGMMTRNQRHLQETPAELLHLAQHHFATGWSGKIVRGNYEGQSVVKLAPVGSHRAEALMTEVSAYHILKEFWSKYVPPLVLYGITV